MSELFTGSFTQQEPIPEAGIAAALDVLRNGRLHRYNVAAGEISPAAILEQNFAAYTGARYCLAITSAAMRSPRRCVRWASNRVTRC